MLLQRTVKVFRRRTFTGFAALAVAVLATVALTDLDPLGLTTWVPGESQVKAVSFRASGGCYYDSNDGMDPQLLREVLALHGAAAQEGPAEDGEESVSLSFTYELTNGRTVERVYMAPLCDSISTLLKDLATDPKVVLHYDSWEECLERAAYVSVSGNLSGNVAVEDVPELLEAIRADCEAGNMAQVYALHTKDDTYYLEITFRTAVYGEEKYVWLNVFPEAENTVQWIRTHKLVG